MCLNLCIKLGRLEEVGCRINGYMRKGSEVDCEVLGRLYEENVS